MGDNLLDIPLLTAQGEHICLRDFGARALLVVNTASRCGFTPQYAGLEALWQRYRDAGLYVLGFPCNQFGGQEPEGDAQIGRFCTLNYGVSFPLFTKLEVNGPQAHPLFVALRRQAPGLLGSTRIKWNFTKFLVSADGARIQRFAPMRKPQTLQKEIEAVLGAFRG